MRTARFSARWALPLVFLLGVSGCDLFGPDDGLSCDGGPDIDVGDTVNGTLQSGDDQDIDGAWLDAYALAVESDRAVTIDMLSDDVDAWLWLLNEDGGVVDSDDDGGLGFNARISRTLDRGCYIVEATTYQAGQTGGYTLQVTGS